MTDFPTGNGVVVDKCAARVVIDRDIRDSAGDRWYWRIRLKASARQSIHVAMARPNLVGQFGPWRKGRKEVGWLSAHPVPDEGFTVDVRPGETVDLCATIPYGYENYTYFARRLGNAMRWSSLARTASGRTSVVGTSYQSNSRPEQRTVLLTARHHACEAMASYVLEGAILAFLAMQASGHPATQETKLLAVPFVDLEGVERGDQGKARHPWDHNRDYGRQGSRYRSTAALRDLIESSISPLFALDLHTPGLRGSIEERPYVVTSGVGDHSGAKALAAALTPDTDLLRLSHRWNQPEAVGQRGCAAWLRSLPRTRVALTIEYPNAVVHGRPVSPVHARQYGAGLLHALLSVADES
ncbi:hypothetical protein [Actinoplanes sp. NPDC049118]|uniref:hypothetical protein n=1 Tax=Actinoplanes sp. NPDC049118 TaxID=3155769 RepID=UPI0033ECA1A4